VYERDRGESTPEGASRRTCVRNRGSSSSVDVTSGPSPGRSITGGFLVVFEGIGGSGKSTLARRLGEGLEAAGWAVRTTREPGGTELGSAIRAILLGKGQAPDPWAEAFLFEADRALTYAEVLKPSLEAGAVVVSDRGPFGTVAYQGFGRSLDLSLIDAMSEAAWRGLSSDLVFVVDVEPRVGLARKRGSDEHDRFDQEDLDFQERAREGYLFAAKRRGAGTLVLDGALPSDQAFGQVWEETLERLEARRTAEGEVKE
jgi:dTMP kinase